MEKGRKKGKKKERKEEWRSRGLRNYLSKLTILFFAPCKSRTCVKRPSNRRKGAIEERRMGAIEERRKGAMEERVQ